MNARNFLDSRCKRLTLITIGILFAVVLAVVLISIPMSDEDVSADDSGKCGDNLTWYFTESTGELRIEGTGSLYNYNYGDVPWDYCCHGVKTLSLPGGLTSIGKHAFYGCTSLASVTIPDSVTSIGDYAFYGCTSLASVTIPDSVISIAHYSFDWCTSLKTVVNDSFLNISKGSRDYGYVAYYADDIVGEVSNTVIDGIGVTYNTHSGKYRVDSYNGVNSVVIIDDCTIDGNIYHPSMIAKDAFHYCKSLTSICIGNSVRFIGIDAFSGCTSLFEVINLSGLNITKGSWDYGHVAEYAMNVFTSKEDSTIEIIDDRFVFGRSEGTNYLVKYVGKDNMVTLPVAVEGEDYEIYRYAFTGCTSLTSITIPDSITYIRDYVFSGCTSLTSITIPDSVTSIGSDAFSGCTSLISITIPDSVTHIGTSVFSGCTSLTSITIPDSVTSIGSYAFSGCTSLASITIPDSVKSIGYFAFYRCTSLISITIPDSVTSISGCAFYECTLLASVTIGNSVTSIGNNTFSGCTSLASVTIGNSVTSIGSDAFSGCPSLFEVINLSGMNITKGSSDYGYVAYYAMNVFTSVEDSTVEIIDGKFVCGRSGNTNYLIKYIGKNNAVVLPNNVMGGDYEIYRRAFYECSSLVSITLPNSVTSIGNYVFYECRSLKTIIMSDSVTSIGEEAFRYCTSLKSIRIPYSINSIGSDTFSGCPSLKTVVNDSFMNIVKGSSSFGCVAYYADNVIGNVSQTTINDMVITYNTHSEKYRVDSYKGTESVVAIDDCIIAGNTYRPFIIANGAFQNCTSLTCISIGSTVRFIGSDAFTGCTGLVSFDVASSNTSFCSEDGILFDKGKTTLLAVPAGKICSSYTIPDSVTSIGFRAFSGCTSLTSITIPDSVTSIGSDAFFGCTSLASITIPDSVTSIGDYAFSRCTSLSSVTIPDSVTSVGSRAFYRCTSLISITIPDSVTHIGTDVFRECTSLTSITIPDSVTSIGSDAFYGCTSLISITIPDSVTSIGSYAFYRCTSLSSVTIPDSVTSVGSRAFYECAAMLSVIIAPGCSGISSNAFSSHIFYRGDATTIITVGNDDFYGYEFIGKTTDKMIRQDGMMPHYVIYDINGGSGKAPIQDDVFEGSSFTVAYYNGTKTGYTFGGWSYSGETYQPGTEIVMGKSDITLKAIWIVNKYTIRFLNDDGTELQSEELDYGFMPFYSGVTPTKKPTAQYTYSFNGWSPKITTVTGAADYTAQYSSTVNKYTVRFLDDDGTELQSQKLDYDSMPEYTGATPTKESTAQYTYTFSGWNPSIVAVTSDADYTAVYSSKVNTYAVTFVNDDGTVLKGPIEYPYGTLAKDIAKPADPTKESTAQYTYTFSGWNPEIADVKSDAVYMAKYASEVNKYTIRFLNYDGSVLQSVTKEYGTMPAYSGDEPTRPADAQYTYSFIGWSPEIVIVTGAADYTAQYASIVNKYTIRFLDDDGTELQSQKLDYGSMPEYSGATPTKESTAQYTYTFAGWSSEIADVTCDADYTAVYSSEVNSYVITFVDDDGTILKEPTEYPYGTLAKDIEKPAYPTKESTAQYTYTFAGWSPEIADVTSDADYTATYASEVNEYTIRFLNYDGYILDSVTKEYGTMPAYSGDTPTRPADAQYTYSFIGWSPEIVIVTGAADYTAQYSSTVNKYTVRFLDDDGTELQSQKLDYGSMPEYTGATPTKESTAQYTYTFAGWDSDIVTVVCDADYTAVYSSKVNSYAITWMNSDVWLGQDMVPYGTVPAYAGEKPTKKPDQQHIYTFIGWNTSDGQSSAISLPAVTGDATYYAAFTTDTSRYTVIWKYQDGSGVYETDSDVPYRAAPSYDGATPTKEKTVQYTYEFAGWSTSMDQTQGTPVADLPVVSGDVTYYAAFSYSVNNYAITFVDDDGTVLKGPTEYPYGTPAKDIVRPEDPTKEPTAQYTYTFAGWSPDIVEVKSDVTYTATYTSTVNSYVISFLNYDGSTLYSVMTEYGKLPAYSGDEPTRPADAQYTYTFSGWDPEVVVVTGVADYTAQYTSVLNKYSILFLNYNGTVLQSEKLDYGSIPVYSGDIPTKESDVYHTYEFSGWSPEIVAVTEDAEYTAVYKTLDREYTISFNVDGGSIPLDDVTVTAGNDYTLPNYDGAKKAVTFDGWLYGSVKYSSGDSVTVLSDMLFKAAWTDKPKHSVTYELDGGSGTAPTQDDVIEDLTFTVASYDGTKAGYSFGGWSYSGKTYQPGSQITMATSDITLTAVWNDKPMHHVTYDTNGGSSVAPVQEDVKEGLSFIVKGYDGTKAGFSFQNWSCNGIAYKAGDEAIMGTSDIVLKAVWISNGKEAVIEIDDDNAPLTSDTVKELKDKAVADPESTAVFELDSATVEFDNAALRSLDGTKAATLAAKVIPDSELPESVKKIVAGGTVIDMSFGANRNFNNGKVTITVPFVLAEGKSADDLKVYFIENGQIKETVDGTYENGFMTFTVSHFSMYGIAYTEQPAPAPADSGNSMFIIIGAVVAVIVVAAIAVVVVKRKQ